MHFRQAVLQDEEELFPLAASLATSFELNKADFSRILAEHISDANVDLVIAETESKVIGYVLAFHHSTFYANGVVSWVEELFVTDEFRGRNVGQKLMEIIEESALKRGSKLVALATRRAGAFYRAIGYEESAVYFKKALIQEHKVFRQ
ncbi:GNAT family N-acetyltransferase [Cohnella sp. CFH 77786]|nr:GNAT family N-acetyltransferase [Cohnella sp. CFH 77786]